MNELVIMYFRVRETKVEKKVSVCVDFVQRCSMPSVQQTVGSKRQIQRRGHYLEGMGSSEGRSSYYRLLIEGGKEGEGRIGGYCSESVAGGSVHSDERKSDDSAVLEQFLTCWSCYYAVGGRLSCTWT